MNPKYLKIVFLVLVLSWFGFFFAKKIDLTVADTGRHIKNGEIILTADFTEKISVLRSNFYSYTMPAAPFINHHWGSGVVFYLAWKTVGFYGLSAFYIFLGLFAVFLFWDIARKLSDFSVATMLGLVLLPLIVSRTEIRPEIFTYFLSGLSCWILYNRRYLWFLPSLMLLWVNLHIGFIFGFLILGAFGLEELIKFFKKESNDFKKLLAVSLAAGATSFINPFGYRAVLYPFEIFKNYGYRIVENQSIGFLENMGFGANMHFFLFKVIALYFVVLFIFLLIKGVKIPVSIFILAIVSGIMGYLGVRHFPSFALFVWLPLAFGSHFLYSVFSDSKKDIVRGGVAILILGTVIFQMKDFGRLKPVWGLGLLPAVNASADFFKDNQIKGPIFNNYDIGGYLIYHLFPQEKVFVDNRPEGYSEKFFQEIYIPAQEKNENWLALERQYNFNAIFFSHRDYTPWGQKFLIERIGDPNWAPVFADSYNIIFLKRNAKNTELIKKFEISKERFGIRINQ